MKRQSRSHLEKEPVLTVSQTGHVKCRWEVVWYTALRKEDLGGGIIIEDVIGSDVTKNMN